MPQIKPYGLWNSPITARSLAGQLRLNDVRFTQSGALVWSESRGRQGVLVAKLGDDAPRDLTTEVSAKGGVGYGGGDFGVSGEDVFFASSDSRLYRVSTSDGRPKALTPAFGGLASPTPSPDGEWVAYVHTHEGEDVVGIVSSKGGWPAKLVQGADFYAQPAWNPDGKQLAWVAWDQPQMPWNGARIEIAEVGFGEGGPYTKETRVLAGSADIAAQQPTFSPDGNLLAFMSDESNWIEIYVHDLGSGETRQLSSAGCDHGHPLWIQGMRTMRWAPDGQSIYALRNVAGVFSLWNYPLDGSAPTKVSGFEEYTSLDQLDVSADGRIAALASASAIPPRVVCASAPSEPARVVRRASAEQVAAEHLSKMEPVSWSAEDGTTVFGNYYAPANPGYEAPSGKPPAIIMIHGGPTAQSTAGWVPRNQFFATRGYAVLDVNYRGSTGYGREYMSSLLGQWGVLDVEDAVGAAKFLADEGLADPDRIVIMGGSAGGYTVLHSLVKAPGVFAAGVSMYGISNLFTLAAGTHKFEASYNDSLVGALPEAAELYRERSPIFGAQNMVDPVAVFQGTDDTVVPKDQADAIVASLRQRGVPHEYHVYEGEGHGWRKPETIEHFYNAVLDFLRQYIIFS